MTALGEQTVTVPGTAAADTVLPRVADSLAAPAPASRANTPPEPAARPGGAPRFQSIGGGRRNARERWPVGLVVHIVGGLWTKIGRAHV